MSPKVKIWENRDYFTNKRYYLQKYDNYEEFEKIIGELSSYPCDIFDQIWPNVNSFGSRGHQTKNVGFHGDGFSLITFLYDR